MSKDEQHGRVTPGATNGVAERDSPDAITEDTVTCRDCGETYNRSDDARHDCRRGTASAMHDDASKGLDDHALAGMLEYLASAVDCGASPVADEDVNRNVREARNRARWLRERAERASASVPSDRCLCGVPRVNHTQRDLERCAEDQAKRKSHSTAIDLLVGEIERLTQALADARRVSSNASPDPATGLTEADRHYQRGFIDGSRTGSAQPTAIEDAAWALVDDPGSTFKQDALRAALEATPCAGDVARGRAIIEGIGEEMRAGRAASSARIGPAGNHLAACPVHDGGTCECGASRAGRSSCPTQEKK